MPYSSRYYQDHFKYFLEKVIHIRNKECKILDVGCGSGFYGDYIFNNYNIKIDGIEIWKEYIDRFQLMNKYKNLYEIDIINFQYPLKYNLIIFGDILEHLDVSSCIKVLHEAYNNCDDFWIQIPFKYEQGITENNPHEEHKQNNIDECFMKLHYGNYVNLRHYNFNVEGMFGLAIYDKNKN